MARTLSVIVPVFNAGAHLERCLNSLIGQTYKDLEIIVVDDGSTDDSRATISRFVELDRRVCPVFQANRGVSVARNVGIERATGDLIGFLDADDWLEPDTYAVVAEQFNDHPEIDFVTFGYFVDDGLRSDVPSWPVRFTGVQRTAEGLGVVLETRNRFACTRVFKSNLVGETRFREDLHWGEDTVFVVEVVKRAQASVTLANPLYHYVQSGDSATRSKFNPKRLTGVTMTNSLEDLIKNDYPEFVDNVVRTRVNIIGVLLEDAFAPDAQVPSGFVRDLTKTVRGDLGRIVRSRRIPLSAKVKAAVMAASPSLFVGVHRAGLAARSLGSTRGFMNKVGKP